MQLIRGISSDLKKLLKYFNGTTILTLNFTILPSTTGLPNNLTSLSKDFESACVKSAIGLLSGGSSRYIDKVLLMNPDNCLNILLNYK